MPSIDTVTTGGRASSAAACIAGSAAESHASRNMIRAARLSTQHVYHGVRDARQGSSSRSQCVQAEACSRAEQVREHGAAQRLAAFPAHADEVRGLH